MRAEHPEEEENDDSMLKEYIGDIIVCDGSAKLDVEISFEAEDDNEAEKILELLVKGIADKYCEKCMLKDECPCPPAQGAVDRPGKIIPIIVDYVPPFVAR